MKRIILALLVFGAVPAWAGEGADHHQPPVVSAELKRMAELEGHWEGMVKTGDGEAQPTTVDYQVTSGGSAVVETIFPGTPHEMVSVYHDNHGKLAMTHYCMLGNHPELGLVSDADGQMAFKATPETEKELAGQHFMGKLTLERDGEDGLTQYWGGKDGERSTVLTLKRKS